MSRRSGFGWAAIALALAAQAAALRFLGHPEDPTALAAILALAACAFALTPTLLRAASTADRAQAALLAVLALGLAARLAQFGADGVFETDFHRYLLDGATTLAGVNPFAHAPAATLTADGAPIGLSPLPDAARQTLERVNHPELRTIYPGVAQAAFAIAALIEPWSLEAWRVVLLVVDLAVGGTLIAMLVRLGRSPLWVALYWLNPLAIKEIANAGHFEPLLMLFVLLALLAAQMRRPMAAMGALALAVGVKVWPALLAPLILRMVAPSLGAAVAPALLFAAIAGLAFAPAVLAPVDAQSGFVAFSASWVNNAPLFDLAHRAVYAAAGEAGVVGLRGLAAAIPALAALALAWRRPPDDAAALRAAFAIVLILLLCSPVKLPWYMLWVMTLLPLLPLAPLLAIPPVFLLFPAYYAPDGVFSAPPPAESLVAWASAGTLWVVGLLALRRLRHD